MYYGIRNISHSINCYNCNIHWCWFSRFAMAEKKSNAPVCAIPYWANYSTGYFLSALFGHLRVPTYNKKTPTSLPRLLLVCEAVLLLQLF